MKDLRRETEDVKVGRTLLHTCCGPCASACVPRLKEMGREVTMLFANSNIDTKEEFEKRLREAEKLAAIDGVKIVALPYDHEEWLREVAAGYEHEPEKGARCARCFRYNLAKAAEYAKAHGFDEFTTSLTVSPHKVSSMIFDAAETISAPVTKHQSPSTSFLPIDFKKKEGFKISVKRTKELGLYRQGYCGCEFSKWRIHHKDETESTNLDARAGVHGDVFTADYQTAGRGRLDHKWHSPPKTNLIMSVVLSVEGLVPDQVATLPLVAGLSSIKALQKFVTGEEDLRHETGDLELKWPNDVLISGKKLAGILCERHGDNVIIGIGVNVNQTEFVPEIATRATSLALLTGKRFPDRFMEEIAITSVRTAVLRELDRWYSRWRSGGFSAVYPEIAAVDFLKGREIAVRQTDTDAVPVAGVCGGIQPDGSLDVGGTSIYAGETHILL